jgi:TetR/AcrR family transcriptional repressor of nem operon
VNLTSKSGAIVAPPVVATFRCFSISSKKIHSGDTIGGSIVNLELTRMAYSTNHKARTKQRILEAASRLFSAKGYDGTSIEEIMRECGLTRGGFYAHFSSKGQLYRNAFIHSRSADAMLAEYLGGSELESSKLSPAFAFLAIDLASKTPEVRAAYTDAFTSFSDKLLRHSRASAPCVESCSLSTAALIVGTLAVAHTTDNPDLRAKLLASCKEHVGVLLGGTDRSTPTFFWEPTPN